MAGQIGVLPGYVSATNAYRAKKAAKPSGMAAALGTTPATKAALLPSLEGSAGLGLPKVAAPKSIVPQLNLPSALPQSAAPAAAPNTGLGEYTGEITSDPMYAIAKKNYDDALAMGERSAFGDPFKQLLTQYGYVPGEDQINALSPDLQAMVRKYLDPATIAAAQGNPYSVAATTKRAFDQSGAALPIDYAERGLLSAPGKLSGGAAIAQSNLDYQRGQQAATAMGQLLSGIGTANSNWLNYQNDQANTFRQAQEDIATRLSQDAGYHSMLDALGNAVATPDTNDYSGGPNAVFQPSADVGAILDANAASGANASWAKAMSTAINAANKPKPSAKTQKVLKKVKGR